MAVACDPLVGDIVAAERSGALSPEEIPGLCLLLYIAGTETVADFIDNALVALAEHPEQRALLAAEPQRSAVAVEELLRFESPVQYQVRTATAPIELHGVDIPPSRRCGAPRTATSAAGSAPTRSISRASPGATWPSARASTIAWGRRWRGCRAAWCSRRRCARCRATGSPASPRGSPRTTRGGRPAGDRARLTAAPTRLDRC
jgi:hypothetical protein